MNNTKYKLNISEPITQSWLEFNHFFWNKAHSTFMYRFNVWRISETESAYGEIRLNPETLEAEFDVYTAPKNYFGTYYQGKWGLLEDNNLDFLTMVRRIQSEMERLGFIEDPSRSTSIPILKHMKRREET